MKASEWGHTKVVLVLIMAGAELNARASGPVMHGVGFSEQSVNMVSILIKTTAILKKCTFVNVRTIAF
jgi:hypothetical protein